jgi:hypothetical protein
MDKMKMPAGVTPMLEHDRAPKLASGDVAAPVAP